MDNLEKDNLPTLEPTPMPSSNSKSDHHGLTIAGISVLSFIGAYCIYRCIYPPSITYQDEGNAYDPF